MAGEYSGSRNSNTQLLKELESLSESLYQSHTPKPRRTASLALPRDQVPAIPSADEIGSVKVDKKSSSKPRSRRMSLSPWRSRPKFDVDDEQKDEGVALNRQNVKQLEDDRSASTTEKKGIWNWKPIRALSHIGMHKLSCLFSVEIVTAQGLPASMNGLRLSVSVRKTETKDGAVHTMPSRVTQGAADFEETLFVKCHVYCTPPGNGKQTKFESRPFWIYLFAVDARELDFGRSTVDLSKLIQESVEKSSEGTRVRQWDTSFKLLGKASGGELILKLGFQIMEKDGGVGIYSQVEGLNSSESKSLSSSFARKQSKMSFSVSSPRMRSQNEPWTPSQTGTTADLQGIDDLDLDDPAPAVPSSVKKGEEPESKMEDDFPDFDIVDKGVEVQEKEETGEGEGESDGTVGEKSVSSEVVKEVVHDPVHVTRLTELDSIAQQIKALESLIREEDTVKTEEESDSQRLDEDEETVTKEFLQMLEAEETDESNSKSKSNSNEFVIHHLQLDGEEDSTSEVYLPDLGKGIGCVVQTRDGGYLAATNPFDTKVERKETPKLAMQISKPLVLLPSHKSMSGFEVFQHIAGLPVDELSSRVTSLMPLDELMGKTAEQIAFEGVASAIIHGRNKEGASSSAARTIAAVKTMASALSNGRKERILTGIWNINETLVTADEILGISLQKIEDMAVEALKIQADMTEEDGAAPFDVSPVNGKDSDHPLSSTVTLEDWIKSYGLTSSGDSPGDSSTITLAVIVQLRDPVRRYEVVGGPVLAVIQAAREDVKVDKYDMEKRFKVTSLHVGGLKVERGGTKSTMWDSEKQKLTAMQWLVGYGLGKMVKKGKHVTLKREEGVLWSISSRVMADMWLKALRNPDVKLVK